jgi:hypothetical protein
MASPLEQHPGFDTYPEWNMQSEQHATAPAELDVARLAVSEAFKLRGEAGVISIPELTPEAKASAEILISGNNVRANRQEELEAA